jgi:hypothetical protein
LIVQLRRQESTYPVLELVGSSPVSWEDAVRTAIERSSALLWNLRIAEVRELDVRLDDEGKIAEYRAKIRLSLKYDNWKVDLGWKVPRTGRLLPAGESLTSRQEDS